VPEVLTPRAARTSRQPGQPRPLVAAPQDRGAGRGGRGEGVEADREKKRNSGSVPSFPPAGKENETERFPALKRDGTGRGGTGRGGTGGERRGGGRRRVFKRGAPGASLQFASRAGSG